MSVILLTQFFAGALLAVSFFSLGKLRLPALVRSFAIASTFLALMMAGMAVLRDEPSEYLAAGATFLFKAVAIPIFILWEAKKKANVSMQLFSFRRTATTWFIASFVVGLSWFLSTLLPLHTNDTNVSPLFSGLLFVSLSLIFLGFLMMMIRRDLFSQIIGLLTLENGIAAFGVVGVGGVPFLIEMGIFFIIVVSVLSLATLSERVQELYKTTDTNKLSELTD